MKNILIVNFSDIDGGAARASYRLHKSLLENSIKSTMLVVSKSSDDYTVIGPCNKISKFSYKLRSFLDNLPVRFFLKNMNTLFSANFLPSPKIVNLINEMNPDIVHLHWINGGMLSLNDLCKINAKIVWSLHDMWPFTDGYHYDYDYDCDNENLSVNSKKKNILQKIFYLKKQKSYSRLNNLHIIGLSNWIYKCSKSSNLLERFPHYNLPNPIDINKFTKLNQAYSRKLFNLPLDKKLILFGAMNSTSDKRKGFKQLYGCLSELSHEYELVIFGSSKPRVPLGFNQKVHYIGHLHDDESLVCIYNAADVMVVPSLQENLSNAIMESLSCGTPVVGFNIGGNSDMIDHKKNGYLAHPLNLQDLAFGINWVLTHEQPIILSKCARNKVYNNFRSDLVAEKYNQLYDNIIDSEMR